MAEGVLGGRLLRIMGFGCGPNRHSEVMTEPSCRTQRGALDDQLQAIVRASDLLRRHEGAPPAESAAPHWVGLAQREFAANLLSIHELWTAILDSLDEAEDATRRTIVELDNGNG